MEVIIHTITPYNILLLIIGTIYGIIMGALPGIGSAIAMAIVLSFTFGMNPASALILIGAIYASSVYGGSISAILLNTPGTITSTATCFDGYPMSQKGKAGTALGLSATGSMIGGIISILALMIVAPFIAEFALKFSPADYFLLAILGLAFVSSIVGKSVIKGYFSAALGIVFSCMGYHIINGDIRFTMGIEYFIDGIQLIPALIGLFAVSQIISLSKESTSISRSGQLSGSFWTGVKLTFTYPLTLIRSTALGVLFGAIPALGGAAANFLAYTEASRSSRHSIEEFGKGCPEGVVAPETANNAIVGGSLIPTLTLGIPGTPPAAIFLGALMMYGIQPGSDLFFNKGDLVYVLFFGLLLSQFAFFFIGWLGTGFFAKVTLVSNKTLIPIIFIVCLVGAYSVRYVVLDVLIAIVFGYIGYMMNEYGYNNVAFVLALILGPIAEKNFYRALACSDGIIDAFYSSISIILITIILFILLYPGIKNKVKRRKDPNMSI